MLYCLSLYKLKTRKLLWSHMTLKKKKEKGTLKMQNIRKYVLPLYDSFSLLNNKLKVHYI